jgi:RNA polymerase subunit RPABC4/transcription elongation factor Spt4
MEHLTFSDIPGDVLAGLLDKAGTAEGISPRPLMGEPSKQDAYQRAELYAGGFIELPKDDKLSLSPAFTQVATVLLNPRTNVTMRIWGNDSQCAETNIQFPGAIHDGRGVILNQTGGYYSITAFVDNDDITEMLSGIIPGGVEEDIDFEFEAHLDTTVAAVMLSAIDLARNHMKSVKHHDRDVSAFSFTAQELVDYQQERWGLTGFNDMITYAAAAGLMPDSPSLSATIDALSELVKAEVLQESKTGNYSLSPVLEPLVHLTTELRAGLQWQVVSRFSEDELLWSNRIYLFGDRSLILCLSPTIENRVYIARTRKQELIDFLLDEMTTELVSSYPEAPEATEVPAEEEAPMKAKAPAQTRTGATCEQCGAVLRAGVKFCSKCGSAVVSPKVPKTEPTCSNCGNRLKANAKFCTKCGTAVEKSKVVQETPKCRNCGRTLKSGVKFCPGCGTPVETDGIE